MWFLHVSTLFWLCIIYCTVCVRCVRAVSLRRNTGCQNTVWSNSGNVKPTEKWRLHLWLWPRIHPCFCLWDNSHSLTTVFFPQQLAHSVNLLLFMISFCQGSCIKTNHSHLHKTLIFVFNKIVNVVMFSYWLLWPGCNVAHSVCQNLFSLIANESNPAAFCGENIEYVESFPVRHSLRILRLPPSPHDYVQSNTSDSMIHKPQYLGTSLIPY